MTAPIMPAEHTPISVVIPTYNRAGYLLACLDSVLAQLPPPREVIVVDDGSTDDTAARVLRLTRGGRVHYIFQRNAGLAAARNAGAQAATGDYLCFLDDDDLLFPGALHALLTEFDRHPDAGLVYGHAVLFRGALPGPQPPAGRARPTDYTEFLLFNQIGSPGQVLVRRTAFDEVGGFCAHLGRRVDSIRGAEDWNLWLSILARYRGRFVPDAVLAYRLHDDNMSRNVDRMYRSSLRVARWHLASVPSERRPVLRRYAYARLRRYHAPRIARMVADALRSGGWGRAATAAGVWSLAWAVEAGARLALKAHLLRRGQWTLAGEDPLFHISRLDR